VNIDYKIVAEAIAYYELAGYVYIDVPWQVSFGALVITTPSFLSKEDVVKSNPSGFVASGEQSFLQMAIDKKLSKGKYCCATPCFRPNDDLKDGLHFPNFFKVELIEYIGNDFCDTTKTAGKVDSMIEKAAIFMENVLGKDLSIEPIIDDERTGCQSSLCCDIVTPMTKIELGSYGYRVADQIGSWIYGTGAALPRLTIVGDDKWRI
jgi:hypothetical protein